MIEESPCLGKSFRSRSGYDRQREDDARDALHIAHFALGFMITPVLMTALYLLTACL